MGTSRYARVTSSGIIKPSADNAVIESSPFTAPSSRTEDMVYVSVRTVIDTTCVNGLMKCSPSLRFRSCTFPNRIGTPTCPAGTVTTVLKAASIDARNPSPNVAKPIRGLACG